MTAQVISLDPHPGNYLTERQSQRIACLQAVTDLMAGRGVNHASLWAMARWCYDGSES
jgi:hypothetical protein